MDITDALRKPIEELVELVSKEFRNVVKNRLLEYVQHNYQNCLYSKTILNPTVPQRLSSFYVPLFISMTKSPFYGGGDNTNFLSGDRIPTNSPSELFRLNKKLSIVGSAGSGKSTLVKSIFTKCVVEKFKIPVIVELRQLNNFYDQENLAEKNLLDYIHDELLNFHEVATEKSILKRMLESGAFLFIFDGFDEINSFFKSKAENEIEKVSTKYPDNCYVITSRPNSNIEHLGSFVVYSICELSRSDIDMFVSLIFKSPQKEAKKRIQSIISNSENKHYASYIRNPLLLTMFVLTYQLYSELPQFRTTFYKQVYDALFTMHDAISKNSFDRQKVSRLEREEFDIVLQQFSYLTYFSQKFTFTKNQVESVLNKMKELNQDIVFSNDKLIYDLNVSINILTKEGLDYTFPHRSLQEYFTALYIASLDNSKREKIYQLFYEKIRPLNSTDFFVENENLISLIIEVDKFVFTKLVTMKIVEELLLSLKENNQHKVRFLNTKVYIDRHLSVILYRSRMINHFVENLSKGKLDSFRNEYKEITQADVIRLQFDDVDFQYERSIYIESIENIYDSLNNDINEKDNRDDAFLSII